MKTLRHRINAPGGTKKRDGTPVTVLPDGAVLFRGYKVSYQRTDGHINVYKAIRDGILYVIKEADSRDRESIKILVHEQFVLEQFSHSGIQQCIEFFKEEGWQYLVLEHVGGISLDRVISPNPSIFMNERLLFEWANQLYSLFSYLHLEKNDGIYGDTLVKKVIRSPRNIVRDREGKIHLVDIGASPSPEEDENRPSDEAALQPLAAPEFYEGRETDERSDVYTLGAVFYYLLSNGRGRNRETGLYPPLRNINGNISPALEELIMKALQKSPDDRFQTIKAMKSAHSLMKFDTKPDITPEGVGKKALSAKTAAAALCTIMAVILFLFFLCAHKPADKKAVKADPARVAAAPEQGSASQGTAVSLHSSTVDPMLYPENRNPSGLSSPSMTTFTPSAAPSAAAQASIPQSPPAPTPTTSCKKSLPPSIASLHYPTVMPQGGRHYTEPSPEPSKQVVAVKVENLTREERLAKVLVLNPVDLEPAKSVYINQDNDFSISIPSDYYMVKNRGRYNSVFVNVDEKNVESSLRTIQIASARAPKAKPEDTISNFAVSLAASGATIIDQKNFNVKGGTNMLYQAYSFTYEFGPPPGFQTENQKYIHQELYFAHDHSGKAYRVKFCAPADSFAGYFSSEFEFTLRSLHFTISSN